MALSQTTRCQLRLISCHLLGVLAEFIAMPHLLAWGLEMRNVVLAWFLGVVLFLAIATLAGLIWRRWIMRKPLQWALASAIGVPLAIYLLLRLLSGSGPDDAAIALETSIVAGLCALFSSAFFLAWTYLASQTQLANPGGATRP